MRSCSVTRVFHDAQTAELCQAVPLTAISGGSLTVNDFLASSVFRAGVVPLADAATIAISKSTLVGTMLLRKYGKCLPWGPICSWQR